MYGKLFATLKERVPDLRIAGLTATPFRLDSGSPRRGQGRLFDDIVYEATIPELMEAGYLSTARLVATKARYRCCRRSASAKANSSPASSSRRQWPAIMSRQLAPSWYGWPRTGNRSLSSAAASTMRSQCATSCGISASTARRSGAHGPRRARPHCCRISGKADPRRHQHQRAVDRLQRAEHRLHRHAAADDVDRPIRPADRPRFSASRPARTISSCWTLPAM